MSDTPAPNRTSHGPVVTPKQPAAGIQTPGAQVPAHMGHGPAVIFPPVFGMSDMDSKQYYNLVPASHPTMCLMLKNDALGPFMDQQGYVLGTDVGDLRSHFRNNGAYFFCRATGGELGASSTSSLAQYFTQPGNPALSQNWKLTPAPYGYTVESGKFPGYFLSSQGGNATLSHGTGEVWSLKPVVQANLPGFNTTQVGADSKSLKDYATEGAFNLAGAALGSQVPGGASVVNLLYQQIFPTRSLSDILEELRAQIVTQLQGDISQDDVDRAINSFNAAQQYWRTEYPQQRKNNIQTAPATAAQAALDFAKNGQLQQVFSSLYPSSLALGADGTVTCTTETVVAQNKIILGFATYAMAVTLFWSALQEWILLLAYSGADTTGPLASFAAEVADQQKRMALMCKYAWQRRWASFNIRRNTMAPPAGNTIATIDGVPGQAITLMDGSVDCRDQDQPTAPFFPEFDWQDEITNDFVFGRFSQVLTMTQEAYPAQEAHLGHQLAQNLDTTTRTMAATLANHANTAQRAAYLATIMNA